MVQRKAQSWISNLFHSRNNRSSSRKIKRRILLEHLANRQLLAADVMPSWDMPEPPALVASPLVAEGEGGDSSSGTSHSNHSGMMHGQAHPAAMALISMEQATHVAVASGNWSDPATWQNGVLPTAGARVLIPMEHAVTVDGMLQPEFKTVGVHGTLRFATDVNTELRVDTIVSAPHGRLEMGTAANSIQDNVTARVVFADDGAIDRTWDPEQLSRGAILHGPVEIVGSETTHRMTLAVHPQAGSTQLQLTSAPVGWDVGEQIVITGTQGSTSDEVRTISAIDGTTVTLNEALALDHVAPRTDLNVYVANTSRNVQFTSENTATDRRGHIMFMHNPNVSVTGAAFEELGRTDKNKPLDDIFFNFTEDAVGNNTSAGVVFTTTTGPATNIRGRYAVHFHRGGNDIGSQAATIDSSVVMGSPGWGFVNHSSNVNMTNNVAYGVQGASFYTEAGDELGSMVGNIAIRTVSPSFRLGDEGAIDPDLRADVQDFGVDGDGYWLSGHLVSMRDNVSAGASGHGIIIWSDGLVEVDRGRATVKTSNIANGELITGRDTIPTWWAPLAEIKDNESYGATIGFRSRYVHSAGYLGEIGSDFHTPPDQAYIDTLSPTVDGLTVWGSRDGVLMNYNERMSLKNARLIGVGAPYVQNGGTADTGVGIDMYNEISRGPGVIQNVSVEGFNMGILAPRQDTWVIDNVQLRNTTDMLITEPQMNARQMDMTNVTFGSLEGTAVADQAGQRRNLVMSANLEPSSQQPFFFLMSDRVMFNGEQLYFNEQAASFDPTTLIAADPEQVPQEMLGLTNQQLQDRFGTSFGGAIIPQHARTESFLEGGVLGAASGPAATTPPIYHPATEGCEGVIIDPGTLTNFSGPAGCSAGGDDPGDDDPGDDDPGDDDPGDDDPGDDDPGDDDPGDDDPGDDDPGDDDPGDDDPGDDDPGDDDPGDDDPGDDDPGDDDPGDDDPGDDDPGDDDPGDDDPGDDDPGDDDPGDDDPGDDDPGDDDPGDDDPGDDDPGDDDPGDDDPGDDDPGDDDPGDDDPGDDDPGDDDPGDDDPGDDDSGDDDSGDDDSGDDDSGDDDSGDDDSGDDDSGDDDSGDDDSGDDDSGDDDSGDDDSGDDDSGDDDSGDDDSGDDDSGDDDSGDDDSGDDDSGDDDSGDDDSGDDDSGDDDSGDDDSGDDDSGDDDSGDDDSGDDDSGDDDSGDDDSGDDDNPEGDQPADDEGEGSEEGDDCPNGEHDDQGDDSNGDDETGDDSNGDDETGDDETGDDETGDDETGDDETGDDETGDDETGDDETGEDQFGSDSGDAGIDGDQADLVHGEQGSGGNPFHNMMMPTDVNEDQFTTAMDALLLINLLNQQGQFGGTPFAGLMADVSQDDSLSPLDALMVIQELNHIASGKQSVEVAQQASAAIDFVIASALEEEEEEKVLE